MDDGMFREIGESGGYRIELRLPGFEYSPMLLGRIASLIVRRGGWDSGTWAVHAFMYPLLPPPRLGERQLLETAIQVVHDWIARGLVEVRREYTYEFRDGAWRRVENPRWWVEVLRLP